MVIDTTINLGNILVAVFAIISFAVAFTKLGGRIDILAHRVKSVEDTLKTHSESFKGYSDVSTRVAIIETRQATHGQLIANTQTEIQDIRHGRGFIQHRSQGGLDGEYP